MSQGVAIISAATALLALVLAIFGASWLNQRNIERLLDARFDTVISEIKRLEQRIDALDQRLSQLIDSLEQRVGRIERQLEALFKPALPPRA